MPVSIEILDKEYIVSCPEAEKEALLESAKILNDRMRQVRDAGKVLGAERMAVITALNVIHEYQRQHQDQADQVEALGESLGRIRDKIETAASRRRRIEGVD